jgi:ABC-type polysaccharide/polyol phosphate export permease
MDTRVEYNRSPARRWSPLRAMDAVIGDIRELKRSQPIITSLVSTRLKVRYQRSGLGFLWTLINPLMMLTVLAFFLSRVVGRGVDNFAVYLFSGLIPWMFFSESVSDGSRAMLTHEPLIRRVRVQKLAFPIVHLLFPAISMIFAMAALFVILLFVGARLSLPMMVLPLSFMVLMVFTLGVILVSMTLVTYFRDFEHIIQVVLQALYFATPIMYPETLLGDRQWVLEWNPLTHVLRLFKAPLYDGAWPMWDTWLVASLLAIGSLTIGYSVYKRFENDYIFRL